MQIINIFDENGKTLQEIIEFYLIKYYLENDNFISSKEGDNNID